MTRRQPPDHPRLHPPAAYEVGYGRPPEASRFRKGVSGNPRGRPKGSPNRRPAMNEERLKDIVMAEAYRGIKVNDGDRQVTIPMAQAIVRSLALNAAKGQHRAQQLFTELIHRTETSLKALSDSWLATAIEYKVEWERELERRERLGIKGPDPIPHPDDIEIDMRTGQVVVKGPFTREEHHAWMDLAMRRDEGARQIEELRTMHADEKSESIRNIIEQDIAHEQRVVDIITAGIGLWPNRDPDERLRNIRQQRARKRLRS